MTALILSELLALDPATAPDESFDGWTSGGFPARVSLLQAPLRDHAAAAFNTISHWPSQEARNLVFAAREVFSRWFADAAPTPDDTGLDRQAEQRRGEIAQLRVLLQTCRYYDALVAAGTATTDVRKWPGMPAYIPVPPRPRFQPMGQPFDIMAWCDERREILVDPRRVRETRGKLFARGFSDADQKILRAWERTIKDYIRYQFEPVAPDIMLGNAT